VVALFTVQLSNLEESSEPLLDPNEVSHVREEVVDDDEVGNVVDLVVVTPVEDGHEETQLLLEDGEVDNAEDESLTEKEQEEVVAVIIAKGTKMNKSSKDFLDVNEVRDISNETLEDDQVEDVIGSVVALATLEDIGVDAKLLAQVNEIQDVDDGTLVDEACKRSWQGFLLIPLRWMTASRHALLLAMCST
jgi:hypothetical protein